MKNSNKMLIGIVAFLVVASIGGFCLYKYYIVPKHIEPMLELASEALKDGNTQLDLAEFADELVEDGIISKSIAKNYIRNINKYNISQSKPTEGDNQLDSILTEEDIKKHIDEKGEEPSNESMVIAYSRNSNLGIETIRSDADVNNIDPSGYHSYSDKQSQIAENQAEIFLPQEEVLPNEKPQSLYQKITKAMSADEKSIFFNVMRKVSVAELRTLYNSGDKEGIKEHLSSRLDSSTYKKAVSIFYKYAELLYED